MRTGFSVGACLATLIASVSSGTALAGDVIVYVDDDAPPGGDGLSWVSPFRYLQDALAFANNWQNDVGEVRIAQGVYKPDRDEANPDGTGDREEFFPVELLGSLSGGYAGVGSADPDARDIAAFPTVLSGDLNGDDQANFVNFDDNSSTLIYDNDGAVEIDGCTIRSASIGIRSGAVTVTNCRFIRNSKAISAYEYGSGQVSYCEFNGNGHGITVGWGGWMAIHHCQFTNHIEPAVSGAENHFEISDCTFAFNSGGACSLYAATSANITNCQFVRNSAGFGGALYYGHAAPAPSGGLVTNCTFRENSAVKGGAVYTRGDDHTRNNPTFINCVFYQNSALQAGGVIHSIWSDPKLINCTLVRNRAPSGGGIHSASSSTLRVYNSIIKGNYGGSFSSSGTRFVRYSNIGGGHAGAGNIDADPRFVNHANGNLRLRPSSPCIDAGRNAYVFNSITTDVDGNPRFTDRPQTPDTGAGAPPIVDMGAYEFQP